MQPLLKGKGNKLVPQSLFTEFKLGSTLSGETGKHAHVVYVKASGALNIWEILPSDWLEQYNCISGDGRKVYFDKEGKPHRLDGPAEEWVDGTKIWWLNGEKHRLNGPAVEWASGSKEWWVNGELHRFDGPAVERVSGTKEWWVNGELHRFDGPAVEWADGTKEWYVRGKRHRLNGPAIIWSQGGSEWWVNNLDMERHANKPNIPEIMGENFFFLCTNSNPHIRKLALANPNCPPEWKIVKKITQ